MLVKYLENIMVHKMLYQRCMRRNFPYEYLNIYIHVVDDVYYDSFAVAAFESESGLPT